MFISQTRRFLTHPQTKFVFISSHQHHCASSSSSSSKKLKKSYYHHATPLDLVYKTVSQSFDETAHQYANEECFVFKSEQKRYTYQSFKDEVDALAASLLELGFQKNDRVAVWLPNTSENVAMSFAASKLGLIKVNINPAYVGRELEYCLNKVQCKGLILPPSVKVIESFNIFRKLVPELDQHSAKHELSSKAVPTLKHVILTGEQGAAKGTHSYREMVDRGRKMSQKKLDEQQASVNPDSPLCIFYTSGTTGQPKAATLTNFGVVNLVRAQWEHFGQYFTRLCVPIPMFHIFSEVVGVLNVAVAKAKVIFPAVLPDTPSTMKTIHEEKCTALIGAPIIFRDIFNHPDRKKYDFSSLQFGALGASPMHSDFLRQLEKELPVKIVAQGYGMTENAALLCSGLWAGEDDHKRRHSSMGRVMQGLEIKIADPEGNPVPIGEQGEVWARGYPIMLGYYNDPNKTDETLTKAGWLRTGDQATMDEDGFLFFVGRQKEMIIRGGVNIYPIEVENTIVEHPSVAEAAVFSIPDQRYGEEVCAWIKLKADAPAVDAAGITKFLTDKLAFFKIPKHIRFVNQFIMTPTGKVQKFKLTEAMLNELKQNETKK